MIFDFLLAVVGVRAVGSVAEQSPTTSRVLVIMSTNSLLNVFGVANAA